MSEKHTPTPWFVGAQNDQAFIIAGRPPSKSNDYPMHDADRTAIAKVYDDDNAAFIVRAVNSFAAAENLAKALQVIQVAINDGDGGPYWPAREFLKKHDIYDGDLNDLRVLGAVCEVALSAWRKASGCGVTQAEYEALNEELRVK